MTVWNKFKKSKTMWFSMLLTTLGVLELNLHLFYDLLGDKYGATYMIIALITAWLRVITTTSLEDK